MANYEISAEIKANISKFKRPVQQAKKIITDYKKQAESIRDAQLMADGSDVQKKVKIAKEQIDSFKKAKASGALDLAKRLFTGKMRKAKNEMDEFDKIKAEATADVNIGAAASKISALKAMLRSIPNKVRTKVELDTNSFASGFSFLVGRFKAFDRNMDNLANSIRTFNTIFAQVIKGTLVSNISMLAPLIAGLVPVVMTLGTALGVVGSGAFALAAGFATSAGAAVAFGAAAAPTLKAIVDGTAEATDENVKAMRALDKLRGSWKGVTEAIAPEVALAFADAIEGVNKAVEMSVPMFENMARSVGIMADSFNNFMDTQLAKDFFNFMATTGVGIFHDLGFAAGNFGKALMRLTVAFAPLMKYVSQGLQNMSIRFEEFTQRVAKSDGLQKFIEYVQTYLPVIGKIFGDTFMGIINLFIAFSSNSGVVLQGLSDLTGRFLAWSKTVSESQGFQEFVRFLQDNGPKMISLIGNIVTFLVALGRALAPVGVIMIEVANVMLPLIANFLTMHPIIGIIAGALTVLIGMFMSLAPTIVAVVTLISPLVAKLGLMGTIAAAGSAIISGLAAAFAFLISPIGLVITALVLLLTQTNIVTDIIKVFKGEMEFSEAIANMATMVMSFITKLGEMALAALTKGAEIILNLITGFVQNLPLWIATIQNMVTTFLTTIATALPGLIEQGRTMLTNLIQGIVTALPLLIETVTQLITQFTTALQQNLPILLEQGRLLLQNLIQGIIQNLPQIIAVVTTIIETYITTVTTLYPLLLQAGLELLVQFITGIAQALPQLVEIAVTLITTLIQGLLEALPRIIEAAIQVINALVTGLTQALPLIIAAALMILQALVQGITTALPVLIEAATMLITTLLEGIVALLPQILQAGIDILLALVDGIIQILPMLVDAAIQIITALVDGLTQALPQIIDAALLIILALIDGLIKVLPQLIEAANQIITALADALIALLPMIIEAGFEILSALVDALIDNLPKIIEAGNEIIDVLVDAIIALLPVIIKAGVDIIIAIVEGIADSADKIVAAGADTVMEFIKAITAEMPSISDIGGSVVDWVVDGIKGMFSSMYESGSSLIGQFADGISAAKDTAVGAVEGVVSAVRGFFPFSPAKEGPLSDIHKLDLGGPVGKSFANAKGEIISPLRNIMGSAKSVIDSAIPGMRGSGSSVGSGLASGINGRIKSVQSASNALASAMESPIVKAANNIAKIMNQTMKMKASINVAKASKKSGGGNSALWNNKAVRRYLQDVTKHGDWMSDFLVDIPKNLKKQAIAKGYKIDKAVHNSDGKYAEKHVKSYLGYVPDATSLTKSLKTQANQKLGNSVQKQNQVNVYVEGNQEWLRAYVNQRNGDEDVMQKF